jgi:hypothetical protein
LYTVLHEVMPMTAFRRTPVLALAAALLAAPAAALAAPAAARACNVPVFRYALDHWPSDPYRLTVFHRGPLAPEDRDALAALDRYAGGAHPAVVLELVNLDDAPDGAKGVPAPPVGAELPHLVVRYPAATRINAPVWAGRLRAGIPAALLDSPARREIARRVKGGDSAVWLLLACGDAAKDAAAETRLRAELQRLEKELKLPPRTPAPEDQVVGEVERPLRLAFSVIRVERSDPAEEVLVRMLLNTEEDLPGRADPMVFPAFGRGRVLPALVGAGITPANIEDAAAFLVGPCSCQVKRDNPGVDLLLTADWGPAATNTAAAPLVAAGTVVPIPRAAPAPAPEPPPPPAAEPNSASPRRLLLAGIGFAGVLVAFTGALALRSRRRASQ